MGCRGILPLAAAIAAAIFLAGCQMPLQESEAAQESAPAAAIPGTDWEGCDADCKWVRRASNRFKCVADTCAKPCHCRVFSRPRKNWDGEWDDRGEWDEDAQEKESDKHYRCWCVKAE